MHKQNHHSHSSTCPNNSRTSKVAHPHHDGSLWLYHFCSGVSVAFISSLSRSTELNAHHDFSPRNYSPNTLTLPIPTPAVRQIFPPILSPFVLCPQSQPPRSPSPPLLMTHHKFSVECSTGTPNPDSYLPLVPTLDLPTLGSFPHTCVENASLLSAFLYPILCYTHFH